MNNDVVPKSYYSMFTCIYKKTTLKKISSPLGTYLFLYLDNILLPLPILLLLYNILELRITQRIMVYYSYNNLPYLLLNI